MISIRNYIALAIKCYFTGGSVIPSFITTSRNRVCQFEESATEIWECTNKCGRRYKNKSSFSRHLKFECGVPKRFHCKLCGKSFAQKENYKTHSIIKHKMVTNV